MIEYFDDSNSWNLTAVMVTACGESISKADDALWPLQGMSWERDSGAGSELLDSRRCGNALVQDSAASPSVGPEGL
jgi:hypothetical protein